MYRLSLTGLILLSSLIARAQAADNSSAIPNTSESVQARSFVDQSYFFPQGRVGLDLGIDFQSSRGDVTELGIKVRENTSTTTQLGVGIIYGIVDTINIGVAGKWASTKAEEKLSDSSATSKGMLDPDIALKWRFLQQSASSPIDMDLGITYSPKTGTSKTATTTDDGNQFRGGDATTVSLSMYRHASSGEFGLVLSHTMVGKSKSEDATSGTESETDSAAATVLGGIGQFPINEKVYVNVAGALVHTTEVTSGTVVADPNNAIVLGGGLRIIIIPDKSYVSLGLAATSSADQDVKIDPTTTRKIENKTTGSFSAGLTFQF